MARIRLVQFEAPCSTVEGPDAARGFPIPDVGLGWTPFQIESRDVELQPWYGPGSGPKPDRTPRVVLTVWLREDES